MKKPRHLPYLFLIVLLLSSSGSYAQQRSKKDWVITLHSRLGDIALVLFDETPQHKQNFLKLVEEGFYDSTRFHRVINQFMIQGGDPDSKPGGLEENIGLGGPGYTLPAEIVPQFKHDKGVLAAARQSDAVNPEKRSSGSQFYIVQNEQGAHHLDGNYTIFGKVISGMAIVDSIAQLPVNAKNMPREDVFITVSMEKLKKKKVTKQYGYTYDPEQ